MTMHFTTRLMVFIATLVLLGTAPHAGQNPPESASMQKQIDALRAQQAALQKQIDDPKAFNASEAAACAADQGKYWQMFDRLFSNQATLALRQLPAHALAIGLNVDTFKTCLDTGKHAAEIKSDSAQAQRAGVTGTPT